MSSPSSAPLAALALLLAPALAAAGDVHTVGPLPADEFPTIQQAVNAAQDGDVILVRDGIYSSFVVDDKELAILSRRPALEAQVLVGTIWVRNLSAGKTLVCSGLVAQGSTSTLQSVGNGALFTDCSGSVRLQACVLRGADGNSAVNSEGSGMAGAEVLQCLDVTFTECEIYGGRTSPYFTGANDSGGIGLRLLDSSVAVWGGRIQGGDGADADSLDGSFGGRGVSNSGSLLFLTGTYVKGGDGGDAEWGGYGGDGGDSLLTFSNGQTFGVDVTFVPGWGGRPPAAAGSFWCVTGRTVRRPAAPSPTSAAPADFPASPSRSSSTAASCR